MPVYGSSGSFISLNCLAPCASCGLHQVRALAHLAPTVHARREHGGHDLCADIVQRLGEDAHRVARGGGVGVLKGDGQDHALAGKDRLAVGAVPPIQEPLDPKETSHLFSAQGLHSVPSVITGGIAEGEGGWKM